MGTKLPDYANIPSFPPPSPVTASGEGWHLTEEEWLLKENVRDFVEKEIAPRFKESFEEETAVKFYHEMLRKLGDAGFLRVAIPEALGGYGMRFTAMGIIAEEIARGDGAIAIHALENPLFVLNMAAIVPEACKQVGEKLLSGEYIIAGAQCSPEGQHNYPEQADIGKFDEETQEWVLNGEKAFSSGGTFADYFLVVGLCEGNQYMWAMPADTPGLIVHHNPEIGASPCSASVTLKNVRVPKSMSALTMSVIDRTSAPLTAMSGLFPACVACMSIGSAEAALDQTTEYLTHRTTHFKPVASLGAIQAKLAYMKAKLEAARCLTYTALHMIEINYKDAILYSHLAKFYTCDICREITAECVQLHGNVGVNPDSGIARHMMDAVVYAIGTGTSDFFINSAAQSMGLPASDNPVVC